ncbi:hypothetical protein N9A45_01310 [bacterium]|nr:hypothetical protein [bacterium]
MVDDGPPTDIVDQPPSENGRHQSRMYPETPMPSQFEDDFEVEEHDTSQSFFGSSLKVLFIALAVAHLWTVWTMRTDMNITLQFLREITQQNKHMTDLLHNQHQVKWQIVPSQL